MHIGRAADAAHLTYCTNIHAGETWDEIFSRISEHLPAVKAATSADQPFGLGLRLSAIATDVLAAPARLAEFQAFLEEGGYYVFTINGFPYGPFHGQRVKEQVYQPDWSRDERLVYSDAMADLLAALLPDGMDGSISTVPGTFKPLASAPGMVDRITDNLIRHAAKLVDIERTSGKTIALALEPEPYCFLETIEETVRYFEGHLFGRNAVLRLGELAGLSAPAAETALRRHLGVCYDVCHAAVEYEDPRGSIEALSAAGIGIPKLQLSAALRISEVTSKTPAALQAFDEPVYLHQVIERRGEELIRFLDLPDALAAVDQAIGADQAIGNEWRVHFHVPIFLDELEHFSTTQDFLRAILELHRKQPISPHLEVETYTWDVLPEAYRGVEVSTAIARELNWVRNALS
ncbi:MAG: metabolite traffic protein EboE [Geminicoccaceae bacterium]